MAEPHSRAWYEEIAKIYGGYFYPWQQVLEGKSGETLFDELLSEILQPQMEVLEAGCGHGLDAARFGPKVASWTGYWASFLNSEQMLLDTPPPHGTLGCKS